MQLKRTLTALTLAASGLLITSPVLAHERDLFTINGKDYLFVVGSLNEPAFVDDKTGVDLRVKLADPADKMNSSAAGTQPVIGLEKTLQVELQAGGQKKILPIGAAYKDPGAYTAPFYPTLATTYSYRIFGTIDSTPFDATFTCKTAGEGAATEKFQEVQLSETVTHKDKVGSYGCFKSKAEAGFPESAKSNYELQQISKETSQNSSPKTTAALVLGVLGTALGSYSIMKRS